MAVFTAALNWACECGWLEYVPKVRKVKTLKLRAAKERPLTKDEFKRMLAVTGVVVGIESADSWRFLLRGLWESALRLDELMNVSWDNPEAIQPVWEPKKHPYLNIPAELQKNDIEESIPLLPWFESLLNEVHAEFRLDWVFNPGPIKHKMNRPTPSKRLKSDWVGKIITRIGKRAGIIVHPGNERTGRKPKYASAHDLRRSCLQRMIDSDVPPELVQRIARHASFETTKRHYVGQNIQLDAKILRELLRN